MGFGESPITHPPVAIEQEFAPLAKAQLKDLGRELKTGEQDSVGVGHTQLCYYFELEHVAVVVVLANVHV